MHRLRPANGHRVPQSKEDWGKLSTPPSAVRGPREQGAGGQSQPGRGAHCGPCTSHSSMPAAPSSEPAFALSSNLRHPPGHLGGSWSSSPPPPVCPLGATGLGPRLCLVFPSCLGTSAAVSPWGRPYPGKGTERAGRHARAQGSLHSGALQHRDWHRARPRVSPKSRVPARGISHCPTGLLCGPRAVPAAPGPSVVRCFFQTASLGRTWRKAGPCSGDTHVPRAQHGHTHALSGTHVPPAVPTGQPQSPGRGSPARPALL